MLGASRSPSLRVPNFAASASQPPTQPGTDHDSGPRSGIASSPLARNASMLALLGAGPLAFRPNSFLDFASEMIANRSPPTPQLVGSISPSAALVAIAASMALPPLFSTSRPICAASGCEAQTMPLTATVSDRVDWPARSTARSAARERASGARPAATARAVTTTVRMGGAGEAGFGSGRLWYAAAGVLQW